MVRCGSLPTESVCCATRRRAPCPTCATRASGNCRYRSAHASTCGAGSVPHTTLCRICAAPTPAGGSHHLCARICTTHRLPGRPAEIRGGSACGSRARRVCSTARSVNGSRSTGLSRCRYLLHGCADVDSTRHWKSRAVLARKCRGVRLSRRDTTTSAAPTRPRLHCPTPPRGGRTWRALSRRVTSHRRSRCDRGRRGHHGGDRACHGAMSEAGGRGEGRCLGSRPNAIIPLYFQ